MVKGDPLDRWIEIGFRVLIHLDDAGVAAMGMGVRAVCELLATVCTHSWSATARLVAVAWTVIGGLVVLRFLGLMG